MEAVIVVGDSAVGKTNLQLRFALDTFESDNKATIGVDFRTKSMNIEVTLRAVHGALAHPTCRARGSRCSSGTPVGPEHVLEWMTNA